MIKLCDAILAHFKGKLDDFVAREPSYFQDPLIPGKFTKPRLFIGDLPPKRTTPKQGEDYPYIVIRPGNTSGTTNSDGAEVQRCKVYIYVGVFSKTQEGDMDVARNGLISLDGVLNTLVTWLQEKRFYSNMPAWERQRNVNKIYETDNDPFYHGTIEAYFDMPQVEETDAEIISALTGTTKTGG